MPNCPVPSVVTFMKFLLTSKVKICVLIRIIWWINVRKCSKMLFDLVFQIRFYYHFQTFLVFHSLNFHSVTLRQSFSNTLSNTKWTKPKRGKKDSERAKKWARTRKRAKKWARMWSNKIKKLGESEEASKNKKVSEQSKKIIWKKGLGTTKKKKLFRKN